MTTNLHEALVVQIRGDQPLCHAFLNWLCEHPEVETFRYGGGGGGNGDYVFPAEHAATVRAFFDAPVQEHGMRASIPYEATSPYDTDEGGMTR